MDRNKRTALVFAGIAAAMVGAAFAAVPAYKLFCQVTGFGGTTQRAEAASENVLDRTVTVRFDASVHRDLGWRFKPSQVSQTLRVGETGLALYEATNRSSAPVVGTATFNVTPTKAGQYFTKIECFCFTEQLLAPGETMAMPVSYFIDPAIADDPRLDEVKEITLSYTFFRSDADPQEIAAVYE